MLQKTVIAHSDAAPNTTDYHVPAFRFKSLPLHGAFDIYKNVQSASDSFF